MSALRLINETTASSVSNVSVTNVFNDDFNIYKIALEIKGVASGSGWVNLNFINSSDSVISTNYAWANKALLSYASFVDNKSASASVLDNIIHLDSNLNTGSGATMYIFNPYNSSSYTHLINKSSGLGFSSGALAIGAKSIGVLKQTDIITGFRINPDDTTTFTEIKIRTFGLAVS